MHAKNTLLFVLASVSLFTAVAQQPAQETRTENELYLPNHSSAASYTPDGSTVASGKMSGSPLFLQKWVSAAFVTKDGKQISDTSLLFNYDKVNRQVVVTQDMQSFFGISMRNVASFTLFAPEGNYVFYSKPAISKRDFFQLVATGKNFSVYKKINTSVGILTDGAVPAKYPSGWLYEGVREASGNAQPGNSTLPVNPSANYVGPGGATMVAAGKDYKIYAKALSTGNAQPAYNYNTAASASPGVKYNDFAVYYIVENTGDNAVVGKFHLTRDSIDDAFGFYSTDKANQYMQSHANAALDDNFVKAMADSFNE